MEILPLKLFRELLLKELLSNYRKKVDIHILSSKSLLFCFKLPLGYFKCDELSLQREGRSIYIHFLRNAFFATKRDYKNFYAIVPKEWEKFVETVKGRLKYLTNQVLWSYTVNPK